MPSSSARPTRSWRKCSNSECRRSSPRQSERQVRRRLDVRIEVGGSHAYASPSGAGEDAAFEQPDAPPATAATRQASRGRRSRLNPKYTFDSFIVGKSNELAHGAAHASPIGPARCTTHWSSTPRSAWQDSPAARHRKACRPQDRVAHLHHRGGLHVRVHQRHPRGQNGGVPRGPTGRRRAAARRHPLPHRQGADTGRLLPHIPTRCT